MSRYSRKKRFVFPNKLRRHPVVSIVLLIFAVLAVLDRMQTPKVIGGGDHDRYHNQVFQVTRVVDGDTIDIDLPDGDKQTTRIRLWGVDTPEVAGSPKGEMHFGPEASAFTRRLVEDRKVRIVLDSKKTRGKYGRLLAYVHIEPDGICLNEQLVETGHGYADPRFAHPYRKQYIALEKNAKRNGYGLWAEVNRDDYPDWRRD